MPQERPLPRMAVKVQPVAKLSPQPMSTRGQTRSLDGLRRRAGLTYRDLAGLTGLSVGRAHRGVADPSSARRGDAARLRQAMRDVIRRRRNSDPDLLSEIRKVAVPFLRSRLDGS